MSSLFTDTIRKTGGTLGTDIRIKNTSVYESDGGTSVTQNLVKAVAKSWINFNGTGTIAARGSLNHSSLTDNGNGRYTVTISNAIDSTDNIVASGLCQDDASTNRHAAQISLLRTSGGSPFTTTTVDITTHHDGQTTTSQDMDFTTLTILGALA